MKNKEFYTAIESILLSNNLCGYYKHNNVQKPAITFHSGHREGNVNGLETIISPAGRVRKRVLSSSYCTSHAIQLIQHEGINNIYKSEQRIFDYCISQGAVDVVTKWVEPDDKQSLLPACMVVAYFLIEDCCDEENCYD